MIMTRARMAATTNPASNEVRFSEDELRFLEDELRFSEDELCELRTADGELRFPEDEFCSAEDQDEVRFVDMSARHCERVEHKLRAEMPFLRVTRVQFIQCTRAVRDFYDMSSAADPTFEPPADPRDASPMVAMPPTAFMSWLPCCVEPEAFIQHNTLQAQQQLTTYASAHAALDLCPARSAWLPPGTHQLILCVAVPTVPTRAFALMRLLVTLEEHDSRLLDSPLLEAMFF